MNDPKKKKTNRLVVDNGYIKTISMQYLFFEKCSLVCTKSRHGVEHCITAVTFSDKKLGSLFKVYDGIKRNKWREI